MVKQKSEFALPRGGPLNWHIHRHFGLIFFWGGGGWRTVLRRKQFYLIYKFKILKSGVLWTSGL